MQRQACHLTLNLNIVELEMGTPQGIKAVTTFILLVCEMEEIG